jgi:hypothetical protein
MSAHAHIHSHPGAPQYAWHIHIHIHIHIPQMACRTHCRCSLESGKSQSPNKAKQSKVGAEPIFEKSVYLGGKRKQKTQMRATRGGRKGGRKGRKSKTTFCIPPTYFASSVFATRKTNSPKGRDCCFFFFFSSYMNICICS